MRLVVVAKFATATEEVFPDRARSRYRGGVSSHDLAGLVLAAGQGTRIAPLSTRRPKPLLPMGLTTTLARAVAGLRARGIDQVVVNASHLAEDVVAAGRALGVAVVVEKDGPLGTAGGLAAARDALDAKRVVIWNGDIVADFDVQLLLSALDDHPTCVAALAVHDRRPAGQGNVGIDAEGYVVRLRSRCFGVEDHGAMFSAIHVLTGRGIDRAPARGCLVADVYHPLMAEGARLRAVPSAGRWHDVGDLASYLAANLDLIGEGSSSIAPSAQIGPAVTLDRCVVGEGCHLAFSGVLHEVVVWPGALVTAPCSRAIVLDDGTNVPVDSLAQLP